MERSFEDLLTGLSDESEPELDDMIVDGSMDNSNLEVTHGKHTLLLRLSTFIGDPKYLLFFPFYDQFSVKTTF